MDMFRSNVSEQQFATWFSPMRLKAYDAAKKELAVYTPSQFFFEYLEEHFRRLIHVTISRFFGGDVKLIYQVEVADNVTVGQESDDNMVEICLHRSYRNGHHRVFDGTFGFSI